MKSFLLLFLIVIIALPIASQLVDSIGENIQFYALEKRFPKANYIVLSQGRMWPVQERPQPYCLGFLFTDLVDDKEVIVSSDVRIIQL